MLKFVTFNIRCDFGQDGENCFCYRKPLILNKLEKEKPDIICFQEVLPHVAEWLKEELKEYYVVGCGRSETLRDEQLTVAYRPKRLNLISMETFWLSPTPYVPASRYEQQSICPRACTEVLMEDLEAQRVFRVMNFHLDHEGAQARERGLAQILEKVDSAVLFPDAPVILAGDFNARPQAPELEALRERPEYRDLTRDIGVTYHDYGNWRHAVQIDHIFATDGFSCEHLGKWEDRDGGVWLSDHYPVCACLEWK